MRYSATKYSALALIAVLLAGCATGGASRSPSGGADDNRFTSAFEHLRAGDYAAAESELNKLARRTPNDPQVLVNLGIAYARSGRLDEANAILTRAIGLKPRAAVAHNELGIVHRLSGRFAEAEKAYRAALNIDPGYAIAHYNLGVLLDIYMRQPEQALMHYEQYLAHAGGDDSKVQLWVKDLRRRTGQGPSTAAASKESERL